ncbi:MAG: Nif11-like leader peptide family natural product precursor [Calothrix sp. MO_167.B12]|nr:Nif11-like leader peptide family natural product precursor [Calothrix sp. MO_167.B12]
MSNNIVEKVKDFLVRLVKDESFRAKLTNKKIEEVRKVMAESGYTFSQNEFEKAAIKILEFKELGEFHDLTEEELVGAVGGLTKDQLSYDIEIQPMYGIIIWPPKDEEPKPDCKPWMCYQAMYGVVVHDLELSEGVIHPDSGYIQ